MIVAVGIIAFLCGSTAGILLSAFLAAADKANPPERTTMGLRQLHDMARDAALERGVDPCRLDAA